MNQPLWLPVNEMTVHDYLAATFKLEAPIPFCRPRPRLTCRDGFSLSVQASSVNYCDPREDLETGYTRVEVGYPSEQVEELMLYAEHPLSPTATVYPYVPVEIVDAVIAAHGGIVEP